MIAISDTAVICDADEQMSGPELQEELQRVARGLVAGGLQRGDRVLVLGRKSVRLTAAILAVPAAGGIVVAPYLGLSADQLRHVVLDTSPSSVLLLDSAPLAVRELIVQMAPYASYHDVRAEGGTSDAALPTGDPSDPALIIYTSGSTGKPKGVVFSKENLRLGAESVCEFYGLTPDDRTLCLLPLCFDAGLNQLLSSLLAGCEAHLREFLLPQHTAQICAEKRITTLTGVPALWRRLAMVPWLADARESMRLWATTGGTMPPELSQELCRLFPNAKPLLMYGFTEAFRATYLPPEQYSAKPTSIGVPIPHAGVAVIGERGGLCGPGEVGELVQFGSLVTLGYWNRPDDTRAKYAPLGEEAHAELLSSGAVRPDHLERVVWSGDDVEVGQDGYFYFQSRRSTLIKSQGFRVSPTEIENACSTSRLTREAIAFGIDRDGEEEIALVAVPGSPETAADELRNHLKKVLASYQVPAVLRLRESLPLTSNGKYDLEALRAELTEELAPHP